MSAATSKSNPSDTDGPAGGPGEPQNLEPSGQHEKGSAAPKRHAAFERATSALRPSRRGRFPLERVLLTGGAICIPIGIIAILVGWWGSAHTSYLWEQNDYMISGGLLGLGLVLIGCAFYFSFWITRQIRTTEAGNQILRRLEAQLSAGSRNGGAPVAHDAPASRPTVVTTARGRLVHLPDCPMVAGKSNLRAVDPDETDLDPCQVCNPFNGRGADQG